MIENGEKMMVKNNFATGHVSNAFFKQDDVEINLEKVVECGIKSLC